MEQLLIVLKREFMVRMHKRAFLFALLGPATAALYLILPLLLASNKAVERLVFVLDQSQDPVLFNVINERLHQEARGGTSYILSQVVVPPDAEIDEVRRHYSTEVAKNDNDAYVVLRPNILQDGAPEYYAKNTSDSSIAHLGRVIAQSISTRHFELAGVARDKIEHYTNLVNMKLIRLSVHGETRDSGQGYWIPLIMFFLMYTSVSNFGRRVMAGVIEEKQTRVVEVVISSVKPFTLMLGKILGIGLVGLTQFGLLMTTVSLILALTRSILSRFGVQIDGLSPSLVAFFITYFLFGYFLFGTIYAIAGALVSNYEDAQQVQRPLTILNMVPAVMLLLVLKDPNGPVSVLLSMFPLFSPSLMMLRIAAITPPLWQIVLSLFLLIASILFAVWIAAKIYRVGILMYGKRPSMEQIGRLLRYA